MRFYADLHVHSKYSRACSRDCDLEHLAWWAALKGVAVVGTGDFTHPAWAEDLRTQLVPAEPGLFRLREDLEREVLRRLPAPCRTPVRFLLSTEISTISKRGDRTRKVHHLLFAPDLDGVAEITRRLARVGNLAADGRPILGLDPRDLLEITLAGGPDCHLVPAHVWTPWFSALGSKSGFDSIEECYLDLAGHIFAAETGLSSDPEMNWRVSGLDRYHLVSNSDAHSPPMLGREATLFDTGLDYFAILAAMRNGEGLAGTVEFFPEEGKYHLDGHRACGIRLEPERTRELDGRCPTCGKPLTVGVLHRVEALADRPAGHRPERARPFQNLISLPQVLGELRDVGPRSKSVAEEVNALIGRLGPEFGILTDVPVEEVGRLGPPLLGEALDRLRRGEVSREAGYDGVYGTIRLFTPEELATAAGPMLFDLGFATPATAAAIAAAPAAPSERVVSPDVAPLHTLPREGGGASVLDGLDPEQRAAATAADGPLLIVAGPGTGKTRTLTHLLAHRVRDLGIPPDRCLALTFTRRATAEMRDRLRALVPEHADRMLVTTFHGLGLRLVRELHDRLGLPAGVRVADEETRLELLRELTGSDDGLRRTADRLSEAKHGRDELGDLTDRYDAALRERGLVDLDDLVTLPVRALGDDPELAAAYRGRWSEVCVDEYQDVDPAQYHLLRLLCPPDGNLRVIGDPDQAIYGFRGAEVGFFLRFQEDSPRPGKSSSRATIGPRPRSSAARCRRSRRRRWCRTARCRRSAATCPTARSSSTGRPTSRTRRPPSPSRSSGCSAGRRCWRSTGARPTACPTSSWRSPTSRSSTGPRRRRSRSLTRWRGADSRSSAAPTNGSWTGPACGRSSTLCARRSPGRARWRRRWPGRSGRRWTTRRPTRMRSWPPRSCSARSRPTAAPTSAAS